MRNPAAKTFPFGQLFPILLVKGNAFFHIGGKQGVEFRSQARVRNQHILFQVALQGTVGPIAPPAVTSTEFQRIYAGSNMTDPNIFCLAENDMVREMDMEVEETYFYENKAELEARNTLEEFLKP